MSYQGIRAEIPFGFGGLDKSNPATVPINRLTQAENIEIIDKFAGKEGGSLHQNSTAITSTPAILAGFDYIPTLGTKRGIVATSDGKLYKDDGTFTWATTLKSGLTADQPTAISEGGVESFGADKHLFFCNGADQVEVLAADGATTANIATPSTDWATTPPNKMIVHGLRNYAIAGHILYYSTTGDHEDFTGSGSGIFQIYPGEGDELINFASFLGRLFLFKRPYGLYYIDQTADLNDPTKWVIFKVSDKIGCSGVNALAQTPNEAIFTSEEGGLHFLSGAERFGDVLDSDITARLNIEDVFRNDSDLTRLDRVQIVYYEDKKQVWVCYTSNTGTRNDRILKLDVSDIANLKASVTTKDESEAIWIYRDATTQKRKPLLGGHDGFVWTTDENNRNINVTTSYTGKLQTPFTDFSYLDPSLTSKDKILDAVEVVAKPSGDNDISIDTLIDGEYAHTTTFNMGTAGTALGTFQLDVDRLDGAGVINKRKRVTGTGIRYSFIITNSGLNENFNLDKLIVYFRLGAERGRSN